MDDFIKAAGLILVTVILCLTLSGHCKSFSTLLAIGVCCIVCITAAGYIKPVLDFFTQLQNMGELNTELTETLLKSVGIGILSEITALICSDAGNAALGKALQILSTTVILWLSLPLFTSLIQLISQILTNL